MGRLIDADKWIEKLNAIISDEEAPGEIKDHAMFLISEISAESTAYDVDKVVAELVGKAEKYRNIAFEYEKEGLSTKADKYYNRQLGFLHSIGVVRKGGIDG